MGNVGKVIRQLRKERGYTIADIANRVGVSRNSVYKWEDGARPLSIEHALLLCDLFRVDMNYLCGLEPFQYLTNNEEYRYIPIYDCDRLTPYFKKEHITHTLPLPLFALKPNCDYFGVCIQDNALSGVGLEKGDIAIFERSKKIIPGEIGVFVVNSKAIARICAKEGLNTANTDYVSTIINKRNYKVLGKLALKIINVQDSYIPDPESVLLDSL